MAEIRMRQHPQHPQHSCLVRVAVAAACAGLVTTLLACGDDSTGTIMDAGGDSSVPVDSSTADSGATPDSSGDAQDSSTGDVAVDSRVNETGASDSTSEAQADSAQSDSAPTDSAPTEAAPDSPADSTVADSSRPDSAETGSDAPAPPAALQLCPALDSAAGDTTAGACPTTTSTACGTERLSNWSDPIFQEFGLAAQNDCLISSMFDGFTSQNLVDYNTQVDAWTETFFGCPDIDSDAGVGVYGLLPPSLAQHVFTSADLSALSADYIAAVHIAITQDIGANDLTDAQYTAITARLDYLATQAGAIASSSYSFTSTCPVDAGTDASDGAASDAPDGG